MLSLEDAHWRLSALPAMCAGFSGRGVLREGAPADVVIYDFDKLAMRPIEIAHDFPGGEWRRVRKADGYPLHHGEWRNHDARWRADGRVDGTAVAPRQRQLRSSASANGQDVQLLQAQARTQCRRLPPLLAE